MKTLVLMLTLTLGAQSLYANPEDKLKCYEQAYLRMQTLNKKYESSIRSVSYGIMVELEKVEIEEEDSGLDKGDASLASLRSELNEQSEVISNNERSRHAINDELQSCLSLVRD